MSTALVDMFNNQPMTTSLIIADEINIQHKNVIAVARKYLKELQSLGLVAFETRLNTQGSPTEFLWMNESQAIFFLTLQKNTEKVVQFKLALVQAFLVLRDQLTQKAPHTNQPLYLNHRADIRVAADRTFRSVLRACRSAGVKLPKAIARANEVTLHETGINIVDDYEIEIVQDAKLAHYPSYLQFFDSWMKNELPVPCAPCRSSYLYAAYQHWERLQGGNVYPINTVMAAISTHCGFSIKSHWYGTEQRVCARVVMPNGQWFSSNKSKELAQYINTFELALSNWVG